MTSVSRALPAIATTKGNTDLYNAILPGLRSSPKYTPHWYNYDKRGSELFHISANRNPHYHIYQVESTLLNRYADDIVSPYGEGSIIADLGAGDCSKPRILIEALLKNNGTCTFYPVDVAKEFVEENSRRLIDEYPGLEVHPLAGENQHGLKYLQGFAEAKLITHFGNSFSTIAMHEMLPFLETVWDTLQGPNDRYLVGIDVTQNAEIVQKAYGHETWEDFNRNVLTRLNSDFNANFNTEEFEYYLEYIVSSEEMHKIKCPEYVNVGFRSKCDQTIHLGAVDENLHFVKDEIIHLHDPGSMTVKWSWSQFEDFIANAGLSIDKKWVDEGNSSGLLSLKRTKHDN